MNSSIITTKNKTKSYMLTWIIWTSCPQLPPASFSRARLTRPIGGVEEALSVWEQLGSHSNKDSEGTQKKAEWHVERCWNTI